MDMKSLSTAHAQAFAGQVLLTCGPDLTMPVGELDVLDVGSGYGAAAAVLASRCRSVTGIEPMLDLHAAAAELAAGIPNLNFHLGGVESLTDVERYDLMVLDNVCEHLPDHEDASIASTGRCVLVAWCTCSCPTGCGRARFTTGCRSWRGYRCRWPTVTCAGRAVVTTTPMRATRPPIGDFAMRCDRGSPGRGGSHFLAIQRRQFLALPFITASGWPRCVERRRSG